MYSGDVDDQFPFAFNNDWGNPLVWPVVTQPYIKSLAIFHSPFDTNKLQATSAYPASAIAGYGAAISYGSNSAVFWDGGYGGASLNACQGPIVYYPALGWSGTPDAGTGCTSMSQTQVTKVAETILLTDRFSQDLQKIGDPGNPSAVPAGNSFVLLSSGSGSVGNEFFNGAIPNGKIATTVAYPFGPNGGVSIANANRSNFALTDGHAKSMVPAQTDPDPNNQPANNMWSARRP